MTRPNILLTLALLLAAACDRKALPVQFSKICLPKADCTFQATCDLQYIGDLRLDVHRLPATDENLTLFLEVHNQAVSSEDLPNGQVNTRDAYLQQIVVDYEGLTLPGTTTQLQQVVPAGGTAVVGIQAVDSAGVSSIRGVVNAAAVRAQVIANVKAKGIFGDGSSFETPEYRIPFLACYDCVSTCATPPSSASCPHDGQAPNTCP